MKLRNTFGGIGPARSLGSLGDRGTGLVLLFLLVGVMVPAASVLWFMNAAARAQAESARQSVVDAYRGQLRLLRDSVDAAWQKKAEELQGSTEATPAAEFRRIVEGHLADSTIVLDQQGSVVYPAPTTWAQPVAIPSRPAWITAQGYEQHRMWANAATAYERIVASEKDRPLLALASQAQIRCLLRAGDSTAALRVIQRYFLQDFFQRPASTIAAEPAGLEIAANELVLGLQLLPSADRRRGALLDRLTAVLKDVSRYPLSGAQRLFLMREAMSLAEKPVFPMFDAEQLAAQVLEAEQPRVASFGLQPTTIAGVWKLAVSSPDSKLQRIVLYRTDTILAATREVLDPQATASVRFTAIAPELNRTDENAREAVAAGPMLPGWQLGFELLDTKMMEAEGQRRMRVYLWTGYMVIAAMVGMGLFLGRTFRRQLVLSSLKTDLVAAVSHELKTPLASMRLLVDALLDDAELDAEKTRDYLKLISGENQRLTRLIENFLTFSRIERNRQRFELGDVRPAAIVEATFAAVRERFLSTGMSIETLIEADVPMVHVDADAMVTVLVNLLENADKYTARDGDVRAKPISIRVFTRGRDVIFSVSDHGIGIAPADQKRIFRRFYQVDQKLARVAGGCGLGLSIVEHIVRAHGGVVTVESKVGEGSTFSMSLPAAGVARVKTEEIVTA